MRIKLTFSRKAYTHWDNPTYCFPNMKFVDGTYTHLEIKEKSLQVRCLMRLDFTCWWIANGNILLKVCWVYIHLSNSCLCLHCKLIITGLHTVRVFQKKRRRAWTPGRFCEVATGALRLLPLKALAQKVQDYAILKKYQKIVVFLLKKSRNRLKTWSLVSNLKNSFTCCDFDFFFPAGRCSFFWKNIAYLEIFLKEPSLARSVPKSLKVPSLVVKWSDVNEWMNDPFLVLYFSWNIYIIDHVYT